MKIHTAYELGQTVLARRYLNKNHWVTGVVDKMTVEAKLNSVGTPELTVEYLVGYHDGEDSSVLWFWTTERDMAPISPRDQEADVPPGMPTDSDPAGWWRPAPGRADVPPGMPTDSDPPR